MISISGARPTASMSARWISAPTSQELRDFMDAHRGEMTRDLDGDPVYMAPNAFSLNYEAERWPAISFATIKDYQVGTKKAA